MLSTTKNDSSENKPTTNEATDDGNAGVNDFDDSTSTIDANPVFIAHSNLPLRMGTEKNNVNAAALLRLSKHNRKIDEQQDNILRLRVIK